MRWQRLFADLQAEFDEAEAAAERAEDASRRRVEAGAVRLSDRLAGALDRPLTLRCSGAGDVTGVLVEVGADWLLLTDDSRREVLVALSTVRTVAGLGRATAPAADAGQVRARLDLRRAAAGGARARPPRRGAPGPTAGGSPRGAGPGRGAGFSWAGGGARPPFSRPATGRGHRSGWRSAPCGAPARR